MFDYIPDVLQGRSTPRPRRRPTAGTTTTTTTAARRSCCRATRSRARSTPRSRPAAAPRTAASTSTSPSRLPAEEITQAAAVDVPPVQGAGRRRHHQGADGGRPDLPLRDGRHRGRPRHRSCRGARAVRRGRVRRRHARLQPARRQLAVRPAGLRPARRARAPRSTCDALGEPARRSTDETLAEADGRWRWRRSTHEERREPVHAARRAAADDERPGRHHPHGGRDRARRSSELEELKARAAERRRSRATGQFNPGWHLALDLRNMLLVSECVAKAALERAESRGGHTRDDFPAMDPTWRQVNLDLPRRRATASSRHASSRSRHARRTCSTLFEVDELKKYLHRRGADATAQEREH